MKTISDTLELVIDRWDDPGDYPNSLAAGPLPSYDQVCDIEGSITVELETSDLESMDEEQRKDQAHIVEYILEEIEYDLQSVRITKWNTLRVIENQYTFDVRDFDSSSWESPKGSEAEYVPEFDDPFDEDYDDSPF